MKRKLKLLLGSTSEKIGHPSRPDYFGDEATHAGQEDDLEYDDTSFENLSERKQ